MGLGLERAGDGFLENSKGIGERAERHGINQVENKVQNKKTKLKLIFWNVAGIKTKTSGITYEILTLFPSTL